MLTLRKCAPESGGFLLCDEVEVCPSAKTVWCLTISRMILDPAQPTLRWGRCRVFDHSYSLGRSFPSKKKEVGGGCDSGGAPSGVPPFPPPQKEKGKKKDPPPKKKRTKKKERGGGLDAPFVWLSPGWHSTAIVLIPLVVFAHACELHPVSYVSFPCTRGKKRKRERWGYIRVVQHAANHAHERFHSQSLSSAVDALNAP